MARQGVVFFACRQEPDNGVTVADPEPVQPPNRSAEAEPASREYLVDLVSTQRLGRETGPIQIYDAGLRATRETKSAFCVRGPRSLPSGSGEEPEALSPILAGVINQ